MKTIFVAALTFIIFLFPGNEIQEYFSVNEKLSFNKTKFELKWSDHPRDNYYIQEYLPKKETLENFNQMLTIHLFDANINLKDAVNKKISELELRKETDKVCNFQVVESPDGNEFILDFLLSESKNDKLNIVEFNVYHYRKVKLKKKSDAIAVYSYSKRAYKGKITEFFNNIKEDRQKHLDEMMSIAKPEIRLK